MFKSPWPLTALFLLVHLVIAGAVPLVEDEGYYALWASVPSAGYYDHPPMIAWLIWPGVQLFGLTPFGIRLGTVLAYGLASLAVWDCARLVTGQREAGGWAVLYFNLSLLTLGLGNIASPDAPSVLFWALAVWAALRVIEGRGAGWWIAFGLAVGAGGISKFTNVFLAVGALGWLVSTRAGRTRLLSPWPWVAVAVALAVVAPYLWWNWAHHWLGFQRQFSRVTDPAFSPATIPQYLVVTFLLPTPLIAWFALRGSAARGMSPPGARSFLLWSALPLLVFLLYQSTTSPVQPNWTAPLQATFAVWAAVWSRGLPRARRWLAAGIGLAMSGGLLVVAETPFVPLGTVHNPPNQMRGWPQTLADLRAEAARSGAVWIATTRYGLTGHLWVQMPDLPVWSVTEPDRYLFRGPFPQDLCSAPGLLVEQRPAPGDDPTRYFREVGTATRVLRKALGLTLAAYRVVPVRGVLNPALCPGG